MKTVHAASIAAAILATIILGISPGLYGWHQWHCYWFPRAPICSQ